MTTLYENFLAGTITDNPLTNSATTINSTSFANLPAIASPDIMYLVLDADSTDGAPEVVTVTAHTASATSVTVTRGSQSSSARQHLSGTDWAAALTKVDIAPAWVDFTPSWNNISTTSSDGRYGYVPGGMWIQFSGIFSGAATGTISFDLPNSETYLSTPPIAWGVARFFDVGTPANTQFGAAVVKDTASAVEFRAAGDNGAVNATNPFTWASADRIDGQIFVAL